MQLNGNPIVVLWVLWLLVDGLVVAGIAVRQFQLWRRAARGERLPSFLVFIIFSGWSLGGCCWLVAILSLGNVQLPIRYTLLMLIARTLGTIPVWLWLGMLVGGIKEKPSLIPERAAPSGDRPVSEWEDRIRRIVREEIDRPDGRGLDTSQESFSAP